MIPEIVTAAADMALAVENGVAMRRKPTEPPSPPAPPAASVAAAGISGTEFLIGMMILALSLVAAALIIHHGLAA